jgi:hypothetical protein
MPVEADVSPYCDLSAVGWEALSANFRTAAGTLPSVLQEPNGELHPDRVEIGYLLYSIATSGPAYRLVSLGAAPGEWPIRAAVACGAIKPARDCRSLNVEADAGHVAITEANLANNGLQPERHKVLRAVAAWRDGWAYFPVIKSGVDWGAGIAAISDRPDELASNILISETAKRDRLAASGATTMEYQTVPAVTLRTLFVETGPVDCVHCDIQGAEAAVFPASMDAMNSMVRICCVATHGVQIERTLIETFDQHGWKLGAAAPCVPTPESTEIVTRDGAFAWVNPRLHHV